jgi:hypothetical protein
MSVMTKAREIVDMQNKAITLCCFGDSQIIRVPR